MNLVADGLVYTALLTKTIGHLVLRAAEADAPIQQAGDFADTVSRYLEQVKELEKDKRDAADMQAKMLATHAFQLAADPTKSSGVPTALKTVPPIDLTAMDSAVSRLSASAKAYDAAFAQNAASLMPAARARLASLMQPIDQLLAPSAGLPERPYYSGRPSSFCWGRHYSIEYPLLDPRISCHVRGSASSGP